jgi:tRNA(fMet)-specific endonuclease VapC
MAVKRYLFDSGIMSALIDHSPAVIDRVRKERKAGNRIGTGTPIVGELFSGLQFSSSRDKNEVRLRRVLSELIIWPYDLLAAERYGHTHAELRRIGRQMQTIDTMAAAIAMTLGNCTVVSTDTDLNAVPGLSVENWLKT